MNKRFLTFAIGLAFASAATMAVADGLIPGWLTDPTAVKEAAGEVIGYMPPESLRFPYVSTYYVKPTVTPDEDVKIGFFVTDFESSKIRFFDDSHRFMAYLEYRRVQSRLVSGASTVLTLTDLHSGDAEFNLGHLPVGDYELRVWVKDAQGRESHRVIQDFRVVAAADLVIPADKIYTATAADLAAYGIRNDGNFEEIVYVGADGSEVVKAKRADVPGYTVSVPLTEEGKVPYRAYEQASVTYDAGYDRNAVEVAAVATAQGLQRLIDDKAAAGYRKLVLPPGTYRVSHTVPIGLPDRFTLDLGGATIKLNSFTGESSIIFHLQSTIDSHIVNGTVEGDYWAHDYAGSTKDSEWVSGVEIGGDSWYSSFENLRVVDITGYGGQNGIASDDRGSLAFIYQYLPSFAAGGLNPRTGAVDTSDTYRFTTDYKDLTKVFQEITQKNGRRRLQICKYLGYQGIRTRSWQMTVCWYDAQKRFISSETAWQYREMWIPANAQYLRVSIEEGSVSAANSDELMITGFRLPVNCAVKNCTFEHCRCVGYAASAMRNMLFEGNFFTRSGEAEAKCAFDAEDGADQMQDVYFLRNTFRDNPVNNSILTCAGHNFILEQNDGDIYFHGRTHSPCVRDNNINSGTYYCDSRLRSGYGRFEGNRYSKGVKFGLNDTTPRPDSWDYVLSNKTIDGDNGNFSIEIGKAGRVVGCTFRNLTSVGLGTAYASVFENCKGWCSASNLREVTIVDSLFKPFYGTSDWRNCHISDSELNTVRATVFTDCDFTDALVFGLSSTHIEMTDCAFTNSAVEGNWWDAPAEIRIRDCEIVTDAKPFLKLGVYTIGDILLEGCTVTGPRELVNFRDLRRSNEDPGTMTFKDITWSGSATKVVTHSEGVAPGETLSTKEVTFIDANGGWPAGVSVVTDLLPTWRLIGGETPAPPPVGDFTWYVSPSGNDARDGRSPGTAFATIAHAVAVAEEGQVICLLSGTHRIGAEISVNKAIALIGEGWKKTIIRPASAGQGRCITLDGGARLEHVTLTGGKSEDAGAGALVKNGTLSWCCVSNNTVTGSAKAGAGISFTGGQGRVDHCIVTDNTLGSSSWGAGIGGVMPKGPVTIDTCLIFGNINPSGSAGGVGIDHPKTPLTVRNCTIVGNTGKYNCGGLYFYNKETGADLFVMNSIIFGNKFNGADGNLKTHSALVDANRIRNTLFGLSSEANGIFGVLHGDPAFVDAAGHDYHLAAESPAIRAGISYAGIGTDLDKRPFATLPSLGCYEYSRPGLRILLQ